MMYPRGTAGQGMGDIVVCSRCGWEDAEYRLGRKDVMSYEQLLAKIQDEYSEAGEKGTT